MKAYQIFQAISPELGKSIFQDLRDTHKEVYTSALASLAQQKRLRPVFVQRKPVPQQIEWMVKTAKQKVADGVTEHVLQIWLLKSQQEMLIEFLDALGVEHDDEGTVDDLPETLDGKKLKSAVDLLLGKYPRENVVLYLHMFQMQRPGGWEEVTEILEKDDRLYFNEPKAEAAATPAPAKAKEAAPPEEEEKDTEVTADAEHTEEEVPETSEIDTDEEDSSAKKEVS